VALALVAITGVAVWNLKPEAPRPVAKFALPLPPGVLLTGTGFHVVAISPDGTRFVFSANRQLYLRAMDETEATPIRGTQGALNPFFSPDGEWVGFFGQGKLKKIPIRGGAPVNLCDATPVMGVRWGVDDTIVFGQRRVGILRVSADGGTPEVLIADEETGVWRHGPQVLPGDQAVLFTLGSISNWDDAQIVVHSFETGESKVLIEGGRDGRYLPTGHLVYVQENTLFAVAFDVDRLELRGGSVPMAEGVMVARGFSGAADFSVSDTGSLVYASGGTQENRRLVWADREGNEEALGAEPRGYTYPRISPDGGRLALDVRGQENDIWVWLFAQETLTRLTFATSFDSYPVWSRDGTRIAFSSDRDGELNLYWKAADGTGAVEQLTESELAKFPYTFSPDGNWLVYRQDDPARGHDLGVLSLGDGSSELLLAREFNEWNAEISPDGRWLAYQSDESGRDEIYVRPFPSVDEGQWQVSTGGGTRPVWAPDGRELFYMDPSRQLMAARVRTGANFSLGSAEVLFDARDYGAGGSVGRSYDISPDGKRFLMVKEGGDETSATEFILVQNWFEELKRLVPTDN